MSRKHSVYLCGQFSLESMFHVINIQWILATILLHDISDEMCQSGIWLLYRFGGFSRYVTCQHFITPLPFHDLLKGTSHFMVWLRETYDRHFSTHVDTSDVRSNKTNTSKQFNSIFSFGFDLERIIWIPKFWTEYLLNFLISKIISRLFVFTQNGYSKRLLKMSIGN